MYLNAMELHFDDNNVDDDGGRLMCVCFGFGAWPKERHLNGVTPRVELADHRLNDLTFTLLSTQFDQPPMPIVGNVISPIQCVGTLSTIPLVLYHHKQGV